MSEAGAMSMRQTRFEGPDGPPGAQTAIELQRDGGQGDWAYALAALRRPEQFFQAGDVYRMQAYVRDVDGTGEEIGLLLANHQFQHRPTQASVYAGYDDSSWHLLSRTFVATGGAAEDTGLYFALPAAGAMHWEVTRASVQQVRTSGPRRISGPASTVLSFTGGAPKATQWGYDLGGATPGELQKYTSSPANAHVDGAGDLVLVARKAGGAYTSARLTTRGRAAVAPGSYVEVAVKAPAAAGVRPVVALTGTSITQVGWPAAGELDLLAAGGGDQAIAHLAAKSSKTQDMPYSVHDAGGDPKSSDDGQTHRYGVYFDDVSARFYVDRVERGAVWASDAADSGRAWPFGSPQYLSLAISVDKDAASTPFPQQLTVGPISIWTGGLPFS